MSGMDRVSFPPRRSFRRIWIIMAGFGVFIPVGLVIYFAAGQREGLLVAGFGLLPVLYMLYRVLSPGSVYETGRDGIYLKYGSSKRLIPPEDIRGAAVLSEEQARDILKRYMSPAIDGERERDLKQWYRSNLAYGNFTRFCTVPIVQETVSKGHEINIVKFGTKVAGRFIILKLTSGEEFLLSPEDCDGFFVKLSSMVHLADTTPDSSYSYTMDPVRRRKKRNFLTWYRWIGVAVVFVAVIVFFWQDLTSPADTGQETGEQAVETGWIDADTYRFIVNARIETHEEDPEARRQELIHAVAGGYQFNFISQVIGWYCEERKLDPDEEEYEALHNAMFDLINRHDPEILSSTFNDAYTEMTTVMEMVDTDLKKTIRTRLEGALEEVR